MTVNLKMGVEQTLEMLCMSDTH